MMPPLLMRVHVVSMTGQNVRLWVPLFLLWLLLLPFALVLLPVVFVLCLFVDVDPFHALSLALSCIAALSGTHVEVDTPSAMVLFQIL